MLSYIHKEQIWNNKKGRDTMEKLCYTVAELATVLSIGKNKAYDLVHRKDFPAIELGSRIIVPADALQRWLDAQAGGDAN